MNVAYRSHATGNNEWSKKIPDWTVLYALPLTLALSLFIVAPCAAQTETPIPGHQRSIEVPRIEPVEESTIAAPVIDGQLDDAVWTQAGVSNAFWNSIQDRPPSNQTEVLVIQDDKYLYFGFRMYDDNPQAIQATRKIRDVGLGYDDSITIELDTFFNRRDISKFSLNPIGTQSDEIAGGRSAKIEWKGDWVGAGTRTEFGWSAEFAIPFSILNYDKNTTTFGVNFRRYQSRTREYSYWANVTPQVLDEEMGQLNGLAVPLSPKKKAWTFMPFALAGKNIPNKRGKIKDTLVSAGMDMRYQPRPDLTGMFAINPDFSQVEKAVTDISFSYSEKAVDDNRPFFIEGSDYFSAKDDENEYFYSNRVPDFNAGAKSFGRIGRGQFGILATQAPDDRFDFVGRTLYEIDETNSAIASLGATRQLEFDNLLALIQFRGRHPRSGFNYAFDAALTDTSQVTDPEIPEGNGSHYKVALGWKSDYVYIKTSGDKYDANYFPANALLDSDLPGTQGVKLTTGYYREMSHPVWRVVEGYIGAKYRETDADERQEQKIYGSGSMEFINDIRLGFYAEEGPYRPVSDTRGVFKAKVNHDRYYSIFTDFNTRSSRLAGGLQYDWGDLGGGPYEYYAAYGWCRPVNPLYLKVSAEHTESFGKYNQVVVVSSWDITPEHSLGGRYIYTDDVKYYRLAYSHRARRGLDIFVVYDNNTLEKAEFSVKIVKTF